MTTRLRALPITFAFLTRVPIKHGEMTSMGPIAGWFPFVGAVIALPMSAAWWLGYQYLTPFIGAVLAVACGVLLTGAFHLDGLADTFDGLVGGWTQERRREILKDSRLGTYGVAALLLQVLLQVAVLSSFTQAAGVVAIICAQSFARLGAVWVMRAGRGLDEDLGSVGLGANYVRDVRRSDVVFASVIGLIVVFALLSIWALVVVAVAILVGQLVIRWAIKRIGGIVGDVLGATEQLCETAILLAIAVMFAQGVSIPWF